MGDGSDALSDLDAAILGVQGLLTGAVSLDVLLTRVAAFAVAAIHGADGAGVTMFDEGQPDVVVATARFVRAVDEVQYRLSQGPCVTAAAERTPQRAGSLATDARWPDFGPQAALLGAHSALSVPIVVGEETLGALNVYGTEANAFDERAARVAEAFAGPASVAVHNARVLAQAERRNAQLHTALITRATIDQAIGIIRSRTGADSDEAFARLRRVSQRDNVKLNVVAQRLVDESVRRARARVQEQLPPH